jgi:hypothetical protein
MVKLIVRTDNLRINALGVAGTERDWVYNFEIRRWYKVLGVPVSKQIHMHTFTFPRTSNNPRRDGLNRAVAEQRAAVLPYIR